MLTRTFVAAAFLLPVPALAGTVLYLDGAVVERQVVARRGVAEIDIPAGAEKSLRVTAREPVVVERVEIVPVLPAPKVRKRIAALQERIAVQEDRLKVLEAREEIFRGAAKSQSGKSPRRTKTNPEPLSTIRSGTDYAMNELSSVFQARRHAEKALAELHEELGRVKKEAGAASRARIRLSSPRATASVSWIDPTPSWSPRYDLRVSGSRAELSMRPQAGGNAIPPLRYVAKRLADPVPAPPRSCGVDGTLLETSVAVTEEKFSVLPLPTASFTLVNDSGTRIEGGTASCFRGGYLGEIVLPSMATGEKAQVVCGKM